ncbi:MAG: hypothetical protein QOI95_1350 [Acidimicrobiaceae bacterium]|jgi:uncharacterized metal-binding protein
MSRAVMRAVALFAAVSMCAAAAACSGGGSKGGDSASGAGKGSTEIPKDVVADSKLLPPAALDPGGDPDEAVRALADQVVAGGEGGAAPMLTALARSGLKVLDIDGTAVQAPGEPFQGVDVRSGEVIPMATLAARDPSTTLDEFTAGLSLAMSGNDQDPAVVASLSDALLADIKTAADSDNPTFRFFARFIAALAPDETPAHDLLAATDGRTVTLTDAQAVLISLRFSADLRSIDPAAKSVPGSSSSDSGSAARDLAVERIAYRDGDKAPCSLGDKTKDALDYAIGGLSIGWDRFLGGIEKVLPAGAAEVASKTNTALTLAGIAMAWAKEFIARALLNVSFELVGGEPLVRTRQTLGSGELRTLRATITYKQGKSEYLNCLRAGLAASGLDVGMPERGPIADADVVWHGHPPAFGTGLDTKGTWIEFKETPKQRTNATGQVEMDVEGKSQVHDLPPDPDELIRKTTVSIEVDLEESSLGKNILTIVGAVLSGPLSVLSVGLLRALALVHPAGATTTFKVKDYGDDYHIHNAIGAGVRLDGDICNAFDNDWNLQVSGSSTVSGLTATFSGALEATVTPDRTGNFQLTFHLDAPGIAAASANATANGSVEVKKGTKPGTATVTLHGDESSAQFFVAFAGTSASADGSGGSNSIDVPATVDQSC